MRALILVAGAALALSACGDKDDDLDIDENEVVVINEDDNVVEKPDIRCDDPATPRKREVCP